MNRVSIEKDGHVAIVRFNRPEKMNALDTEQINSIIETGKQLNEDPSIRSIVLTGNGKAFCAGIDVNSAFDPNGNTNGEQVLARSYGLTNVWQEIVWQWREMPVPVIAAVHGVAFGGGLQIMMGTDIRIVAPDTKLAIMEMKWGLIPDMAGTLIFRHSVREDVVRKLTYTNRVFSGEEALTYGFATEVSETPFEDALALAKEIASKSPSAVVQAKKVLNAAPYLNVEDSMMSESVAQAKLIRSKNQIEAVFSSIQKREGNFEDYRD